MQMTTTCRRLTTAAMATLLAAAITYSPRAEAAIELKSDSGWSATFSGFLNLFMVDTFGPAMPANAGGDLYSRPTSDNSFRVRTGFLPSNFSFGVAAPEWEGMKFKLQIGIYPQLNNANTRTSINPNIDWREFYLTADAAWGQILVGRALNLYQADNVLNDMSLFGVGIPGATAFAGGPTLGHLGFGMLYPAFGAQFRYTTPSLSGVKFAVAVSDPSNVGTATITPLPILEGTLSYNMKNDNISFGAWLGGLWEQAKFPAPISSVTSSVDATGGSAGLTFGVSGLNLLASGFYASGLGSVTELDGDSVDAAGKPITTKGFFLQATYQAGATKLGANYGQTNIDQTTLQQQTPNFNGTKQRQSVTLGVYHDLNKFVKLVAEYSWYNLNWYGGAAQNGNVLTAGGFFFW